MFFYPCPLDPHFNTRDNADALKIPYSYYTFVNPPYDLTRVFIVKALIEYRKGKNIVMIVPSESCESKDFYDIIVEPIAEKSMPRQEIFDGYDKKLEKTVCIVYMLQPEIIDRRI